MKSQLGILLSVLFLFAIGFTGASPPTMDAEDSVVQFQMDAEDVSGIAVEMEAMIQTEKVFDEVVYTIHEAEEVPYTMITATGEKFVSTGYMDINSIGTLEVYCNYIGNSSSRQTLNC